MIYTVVVYFMFYLRLQTQLRRERTEERRKMFQLVNSKKRGDGSGVGDDNDDDDYACMDTTLAKWRKIMPDSGNKQSSDKPIFAFGFAEKKLAGKTALSRGVGLSGGTVDRSRPRKHRYWLRYSVFLYFLKYLLKNKRLKIIMFNKKICSVL